MGIFSSNDMAIDLGTANTLVFVRGRGIVAFEPSVVAVESGTNEVHAVGDEAKMMIGRTPATIVAIRPLRHGAIADFEVTEEMLRYFIRRAHQSRFAHPRLVVCAPSGVTDVEKRAVEEAALSAGAREVHLIEEPLAAALGAGLPIEEPVGRMVVGVGGGTTEVAVLSLGGIVVSNSARTGGYELDEAVTNFVKREHGLAIGEQTAESVKIELGSAMPLDEELTTQIRGHHLVTGLPKTISLTSSEVREALRDPVQLIIDAIHDTLERTPPELSADIAQRGILLSGGTSLLRGFDERVQQETGMHAYRAESPMTTVAIGSGKSLDGLDDLRRRGQSTGRGRKRGRGARR